MAIFRKLHTSFWQDGKVIEELTPEDKFFFMYLLTNPATTQIGIYQITKKQMSFELGYSIESINSLMERFENHHRLIRYNPNTRELGIKNWGKYNLDRSGKPMIDCVKKELDEVSDISLIEYVSKSIKKDDIKKIFKTYISNSKNSDDITDSWKDEESSNSLHKENYYKFNEIDDESYHDTYNDTFKNLGQEEEKYKEKEEDIEKDIDKEKDLKSPNVGKYAKLYEQNIGLINGIAYEWIINISEEIDIELFKKAIEIATDKGKCSKGYIGGIIRQWLNNNIKTYNDLKAYELNKGGSTNDTKSKYAREYENEDESIYQKPTEEQLKRARELFENN